MVQQSCTITPKSAISQTKMQVCVQNMGRTLPSITQVFLQEQSSFARFRRALRRGDQTVLDDLFAAAHQHLAAAAYAGHAQPFEVFLLAMLLEEHKEILRLRSEVEELHVRQ
jgi:cell division inhibitor SulA